MIAGGVGDGSLHETLAHLAGSDALWVARWLGEERATLATGADYPTLEKLVHAWSEAERLRTAWLKAVPADDCDREVAYLSVTRHVMERFPPWQTLLHAANHAAHHRAEACVALTALGSPPESVDLLDWLRAAAPGA